MYRKQSNGWAKHIDFVLLDLICVEIAFYFAYWVRHRATFLYFPELYTRLGILLVVFDVVAILLYNSYKNILQRTRG